jgi:hypothetical protein
MNRVAAKPPLWKCPKCSDRCTTFRLERPDDVDSALEALMREAYRVGTQDLTAKSVLA